MPHKPDCKCNACRTRTGRRKVRTNLSLSQEAIRQLEELAGGGNRTEVVERAINKLWEEGKRDGNV